MNINITTDESDSQLLESFCTATQWRESSGIAREDWINQKVAEFVKERTTVGFIWSATAAERAALVAANMAARQTADTTIGATQITLPPVKIKPTL